jgi:tetratricopeptide (TPR) repeat protein
MQAITRTYSINLLDISITACQSITLGAAGFAGGYYLVHTLFTTTITRIALSAIGVAILGGAPAVQYIAHAFCLYKGYYTVPQPILPNNLTAKSLLQASSDLENAENATRQPFTECQEKQREYDKKWKEYKELNAKKLKQKSTLNLYKQTYVAAYKEKEKQKNAWEQIERERNGQTQNLQAPKTSQNKVAKAEAEYRQAKDNFQKANSKGLEAEENYKKTEAECTKAKADCHAADDECTKAKGTYQKVIEAFKEARSLYEKIHAEREDFMPPISAFVEARSKAFYLQSAIFELYYIAICTTFVALGILNIPQTLILLSTLSLHPFFLALSTYRKSEPNDENLAFWGEIDERIGEEVFS